MSYPTENYGRRKLLIVTADDLGLTRRVNDAIEKAYREGIVTTASLMVNGLAFESAAGLLHDNPGLDAILSAFPTEEGEVRVPKSNLFGLDIEDGYIFRAKRAA